MQYTKLKRIEINFKMNPSQSVLKELKENILNLKLENVNFIVTYRPGMVRVKKKKKKNIPDIEVIEVLLDKQGYQSINRSRRMSLQARTKVKCTDIVQSATHKLAMDDSDVTYNTL